MIGLTTEEKQALTLTASLFNLLVSLEEPHPSDAAEFARDIHNIQNRIMARVAVRTDPTLLRGGK